MGSKRNGLIPKTEMETLIALIKTDYEDMAARRTHRGAKGKWLMVKYLLALRIVARFAALR